MEIKYVYFSLFAILFVGSTIGLILSAIYLHLGCTAYECYYNNTQKGCYVVVSTNITYACLTSQELCSHENAQNTKCYLYKNNKCPLIGYCFSNWIFVFIFSALIELFYVEALLVIISWLYCNWRRKAYMFNIN
jgi:hypothetical protein